jgi:ADP-ribosylglycohydrolase
LLEQLRPGLIYSIKAGKIDANRTLSASYKTERLIREESTTKVGDTLRESHLAMVRNIDGSESPGRFDCYESGLVILSMADIRYGNKRANDAFNALVEIRQAMEIDGRMPLVNGANRHAFVSGMAVSMGEGYVVYLASADKNQDATTTAQTFGTEFVTDPVFVAEQQAFKEEWWKQMRQAEGLTVEATTIFNAALGAVLGALAGDAAGATLEFLGRMPTPDEVNKAMSMVGGGVWNTAPGQITDDGELTLALANALAESSAYDPNRVAHWYRKWFLSHPFDIGNATTNALGSGDLDSPTLAETVMQNALQRNHESKANGGLMRLSALGAWSVNLDLDDAVSAARKDAQLTHPNPSCQWAGVAYVVAIRHLLLHIGDAEGAFSAAEDVLSKSGADEVIGWLRDARTGELPNFHPSAGFVRIGFTHAFYHLIQQHTYEAGIAETLAGGGDTDTNACIVGGLLGALHGANAIPEVMRSGVIDCDTQRGRPRPSWLHTTKIEALVSGLLQKREISSDLSTPSHCT